MTELSFGKLINQLLEFTIMKLILHKSYNNHVWLLDYQDKESIVMLMFHLIILMDHQIQAMDLQTPAMDLIQVIRVMEVTEVIQVMDLDHHVETVMLELLDHVKTLKITSVMLL